MTGSSQFVRVVLDDLDNEYILRSLKTAGRKSQNEIRLAVTVGFRCLSKSNLVGIFVMPPRKIEVHDSAPAAQQQQQQQP